MRALAILTVRNEGAFLLEWLAHHQACGFTDFLVFSNDCNDGTDAMLDRLQDMGQLTHLRNDGPQAEGPQWAALKAAEKHPLRREADWILVCDIDEFVNIHLGDRSLPSLIAAHPQATAFPLTWRLFGNPGIVAYQDQPVTQTFLRAAPALLHWPWRALLFKTLFRNDGGYRKLGVHRPRQPDPDQLSRQLWIDGSGAALPPSFHTGRIFSDLGADHYGEVQLNHYPLGAMESFVVKSDRGRANRDTSPADIGYWVERNFTTDEDRSIHALDSTDRRAALHADPVLGPLHRAAVAWRKARFEALMTEQAWRGFFGRLMMAPPSRILSARAARSIWARGQGGPVPGED